MWVPGPESEIVSYESWNIAKITRNKIGPARETMRETTFHVYDYTPLYVK